MNNIDLIPGDYRERLAKERWMRLFAVVSVLTLVAILSGYGLLRHMTERLAVTVGELQAQKEDSTRRRQDLERVRARKLELEQQLALLRGLRSGAAADQMLLSVDRALEGGEIWFLSWTFQRASVPAGEGGANRNTGSSAPASEAGTGGETQLARTHMKIRGRALDHAALAGFVTRLIQQKEIRDVRVLRTVRRAGRGEPVVDFDLTVAVAAQSGNS